jgi:Mce-associated membrane protein
MNDNDNRRPRRRAARTAGPPVEETAALAVTIGKSESVSPVDVDTEVAAKLAEVPANSADVTVKLAEVPANSADDTVKSAEVPAKSADATVKFADAPAKSAEVTAKSAATTVKSAEDTVTVQDDAVKLPATEPVDLSKSADDKVPASGGRILALAAAIVLVLALVVGAGFAAFTAYSANKDEDLRAQYTATARQAVLNLTTIRAETAKEDIDRILSVASGDFKTEFDGRVDPFMDVVKQANVASTGEVVESGIVSADDESAQVLVAAKQMVSNNGSPEPQSRQYRFRVTVSNGDTGMTVSKVEFVG